MADTDLPTPGQNDPSVSDMSATVRSVPGEQSNVEVTRWLEGGAQMIDLNAGGTDQVEFRFSGDCWIELRESKHGLVYANLSLAGDVLVLHGTAPFNVLLGKATRVQITYNDRPFDHAGHIRQNETARITLSEASTTSDQPHQNPVR